MIILALDTTSRAGSVALLSANTLLGWSSGDADRTHGERLPGDLLTLLATHGTSLHDVALFAVCAGPGSFTGLRVGLATIQGLALATGRRVVPIPTLEALAQAGLERQPSGGLRPALVVPWMNAHRQEVFAAVYQIDGGVLSEYRPAAVGAAEVLLREWAPVLTSSHVLFVGDAVEQTQGAIANLVGQDAATLPAMPPLAPTVARLASARADAATSPHDVRPVYVRRPDAELARERRR